MALPMRVWIRRLHLTLALGVGLFISIISLSGSVLVFGDEIDRMLRPGLRCVATDADAAPATLDHAVDAAQGALADGELLYLFLPKRPTASHEFWFSRGDGHIVKVYVDPYTAEVLGQADEHAGLIGFLHDLHIHLFMGETGTIVVGIFGLALLTLIATGLYLWWPRWGQLRSALRVKWSAPLRRRVYDLHRATGAWSAVLLIFSAGTGVLLVFYAWSAPLLLALFGGAAPPTPPRIDPAPEARPRWQQTLDAARAELSDAEPTWIHFPAAADAPAAVRLRHADNPHPNGNSYVYLDPYRGDPLLTHDWRSAGAGQQLADLKYPLHIGHFGPTLLVRMAMVLVGLMPTLLLVTGTWLYWQRTRLKNRTRTRQRSGAVLPPLTSGAVASHVDHR